MASNLFVFSGEGWSLYSISIFT